MNAPTATETKANKPIGKQLVEMLNRNPKILEGVSFGSITIEIKNGNINRVFISNSILVKPEGNVNEAK